MKQTCGSRAIRVPAAPNALAIVLLSDHQLIERRDVKLRIGALLREQRLPQPTTCQKWTVAWLKWLEETKELSAQGRWIVDQHLRHLRELSFSIRTVEARLRDVTANDPQVQALIEDYNAYVCPVPDSQKIIASELHDPAVANSPTVFPDAHIQSISKAYYSWKNSQELTEWNNTFVPIYQS